MSQEAARKRLPLIETGVRGLDTILGGGLTANRIYLIEGNPGSGKTTLSLEYLRHGADRGERGLYVTLSETKEELEAVAESHGWSLAAIDIVELVASESDLIPDNQYTMFEPSEVELGTTTRAVLDQVDRLRPARVVIDSLSEMRLLAQSALRYRRQVLALKQYFTGRQCTVFLLDDKTSDVADLQLQSIAHGVISLEKISPDYGAERRRLQVAKLRGQKFHGGYHDYTIETGGLAVFPRLVAAAHKPAANAGRLQSGVAELDALLGGGIEHGTSVLLMGPAGSGKSSLSLQFALAATARGERAAVFTYDETLETIRKRASGLGMDLEAPLRAGLLTIQTVDPAELSPGEFADAVRQAAEGQDGGGPARVVVIDSLNGYLNAMPEERYLTIQLHEMFTYLNHKGAVTFLVSAQHGLLGQMDSPVDTTYLADAVILFRFFEAQGEVRQALSVVKKRTGAHERTIREYQLDRTGLRVGEPLRKFHGVLTGVPRLLGSNRPLARPLDE